MVALYRQRGACSWWLALGWSAMRQSLACTPTPAYSNGSVACSTTLSYFNSAGGAASTMRK